MNEVALAIEIPFNPQMTTKRNKSTGSVPVECPATSGERDSAYCGSRFGCLVWSSMHRGDSRRLWCSCDQTRAGEFQREIERERREQRELRERPPGGLALALDRWKPGNLHEASYRDWGDGLPGHALTEGSGILKEEELLGEGGFGFVLGVRHKETKYALKKALADKEVSFSSETRGACNTMAWRRHHRISIVS